MQELDQVDIYRTHRIKSSDQNKCTVIVKFNRFKDREAVLMKASEILDNDSPYTVRQDLKQRDTTHSLPRLSKNQYLTAKHIFIFLFLLIY